MKPPVSQHEYVLALNGRIETGRVGPFYMLGLFIVAVVMVLLPLIYMGMIVGVGFLVYFHATENLSIFSASTAWWLNLLIYVGPMIVGVILIYFMIKPVFAVTQHGSGTAEIKREDEPVLFAFVEQICRCVGAPFPRRIDIDCQVNASASFRRGLFSFFGTDLVLTIGAPLVKGLNLREFAGVLAHEFGHFTQGVAMRLSYVIRSVNFWFARVVAEKDKLDHNLKSAANNTDFRLAIVLQVSRLFVFLTSQVLWGLMMFGHMISSFMLRQMEFDADKYEIKLAGSAAFASTAMQLQILSAASQIAMHEAQQLWHEGSLPNDLADFTLRCVEKIPGDMCTAIEKHIREHRTKWSDTHPSDQERIARAEQENAEGIFEVDAPASVVFQDFGGVCQAASEAQYEWLLGGREQIGRLISTDDAVAETEARRKDDEVLERYFLGTLSQWRPCRVVGWQSASASREELVETLNTARGQMAQGARATVDCLDKQVQLIARRIDARQAMAYLNANLQIEPVQFGLMEATVEEAKRSSSVATAELGKLCGKLGEHDTAVKLRLEAAFQLLYDPDTQSRIERGEQFMSEQVALTRVLNTMGEAFGYSQQLQEELIILTGLLASAEGNEHNPEIAKAIRGCTREALDQMRWGLKTLSEEDYPFTQGDTETTVAEFLLAKFPEAEDIAGVQRASCEYLDKFFLLYFRVLARLAAIAEAVEAAQGLQPMVDAIIARPQPGEVE